MAKPVTLSLLVSRRLQRLFLIAWLLGAVLFLLALLAYYRTDQAYSAVLNKAEEALSSTLDLDNHILSEVSNTGSFLISGDLEAITQRELAHDSVVRDLAEIGGLDIPLASLTVLAGLHDKYDELAGRMIELRQTGRDEQMLELFIAESDPLVMAVQAASRDLLGEARQGLMEASSRYSRNADLIITALAVFFVAGSALGGILFLQDVSPPLRTLDYVENVLANAAATRVYHPIEVPDGANGSFRMIESYNQLARQLMNCNTTILKYVGYLHHEINSLLTSVSGYGYILSDATLRHEDADPADYGRVIVQQTRRASQLVEDFTLAVKIEGNHFAPAMMPLRVGSLMRIVVEEMQEECIKKETQCEINLRGTDEPLFILGDALSLESAFRKMIDNAIRFSPAGKPAQVTVELRTSPSAVSVLIEDQGMGIAAEDIPMLFQPFFRIKRDATRTIHGNGLGLFLASAIIQLHGGRISVESTPGKGSVFTVVLPREE